MLFPPLILGSQQVDNHMVNSPDSADICLSAPVQHAEEDLPIIGTDSGTTVPASTFRAALDSTYATTTCPTSYSASRVPAASAPALGSVPHIPVSSGPASGSVPRVPVSTGLALDPVPPLSATATPNESTWDSAPTAHTGFDPE
jgi:hypothetical protein